jgi:Tol biopolymer transport system component
MPDGSLLFWADGGPDAAGNVLYLPPGATVDGARPFAATSAIEIQPAVSRDGRFVAYAFDTTGRPELYVQPFPPTGAKWQVAANGAVPLWSADGRELWFWSDRVSYSAPVSTSGTFASGASRKRFEVPANAILTFDTSTAASVAPDGRILTARSTSTTETNRHLIVVLDWLARLERSGIGGAR